MRPATHSTDDPPAPIDNLELLEYVNALRRRIEVQQCLMDSLASELGKYRNEVEKLSLDLGLRDMDHGPRWTTTK